jgi:hypothetical protein
LAPKQLKTKTLPERTHRSGATTKNQYHHGDTETRRHGENLLEKKAKATAKAKTTEDKREKFSNE